MREKEVLLSGSHIRQWFPIKKWFFEKPAYVKAVDDVSIALYKGETLGICGESGCGKSTLLRTLLRLIEPTEGTITYHGDDITRLRKKEMKKYRKHMQIVFQDPYSALDSRMRIGKIIEEPLIINQTFRTKKERLARVRSVWTNPTLTAIPTSFPAVSASASLSHAHWPTSRSWFSATKRSPRWMCRCVRRF